MSSYPEVSRLISKLQTERAKLLAAARALLPEQRQPSSHRWSVKEILGHVAMAEGVNVRFARLVVAEDNPIQLAAFARDFPDYAGPFSLDSFNAHMIVKWQDKSLDEVLKALHETRQDSMTWLETLTLRDLDRSGEHAVWGRQTVRGLFKILAIHDKLHTHDLLDFSKT